MIANAFAQVWVVSLAEVVVCWVVLGTAVRLGFSRNHPLVAVTTGVAVAAIAFGVYHFAHSAPFNTLQMVGLLTIVGIATGVFFFSVGGVYGTVIFHNFLALKGVTDALARQGALEQFETLQIPLIITAVAATVVLAAVHRSLASAYR